MRVSSDEVGPHAARVPGRQVGAAPLGRRRRRQLGVGGDGAQRRLAGRVGDRRASEAADGRDPQDGQAGAGVGPGGGAAGHLDLRPGLQAGGDVTGEAPPAGGGLHHQAARRRGRQPTPDGDRPDPVGRTTWGSRVPAARGRHPRRPGIVRHGSGRAHGPRRDGRAAAHDRGPAGAADPIRTVSVVPSTSNTRMRTPTAGSVTPAWGSSGNRYGRRSSNTGWAWPPRM